MANSKKKFTNENQINIFEAILNIQQSQPPSKAAGSFDIDRQFRASISAALKQCPLSRWQVAARMSELTGCDITKSMLDSWTAESKEQHRFPAIFLPAFCEAVASSEPLKILGQIVGVFILPGPEALRAEIRRIDEEISKNLSEKKKRVMFLREMGEG
jgi:hypothetical protein